MAEEEDLREVLRRSSQGDESALEELVRRHLDGLQRFVRRNVDGVLLARESTADLVQSVCREVLQDAHRFEDRGERAFVAWLHEAALRKIIDRQRYWSAQKREARRLVQEPSSPDSPTGERALERLAVTLITPSEDVSLREEVARLRSALAELPPRDRRVIELVHMQGCSHAEAAAELGCSEASSRQVLSRALARLSKRLTRGA